MFPRKFVDYTRRLHARIHTLKDVCLHTSWLTKSCLCVIFNIWHRFFHLISHRCSQCDVPPHDINFRSCYLISYVLSRLSCFHTNMLHVAYRYVLLCENLTRRRPCKSKNCVEARLLTVNTSLSNSIQSNQCSQTWCGMSKVKGCKLRRVRKLKSCVGTSHWLHLWEVRWKYTASYVKCNA